MVIITDTILIIRAWSQIKLFVGKALIIRVFFLLINFVCYVIIIANKYKYCDEEFEKLDIIKRISNIFS